jgi:glycosyltransferase involved in cell wall biosynthesis
LDTVINQTFPLWEQIIIDDGSTDATWEIIQSYARKDPRIRAFRQENIGPFRMVESYNRALSISQANLIAILEGDDRWPLNKLEIQTPFHKTGVMFSYGKTIIIDEYDSEVRPYAEGWSAEFMESWDLRNLLLMRRAGIMPVSTMLDRQPLLSMGGFRTEVITMPDRTVVAFPSVDVPTFLRYLLNKGKVQRTDTVLGYWRQHSSQTTQTYEAVFHEGCFQLCLQGIASTRNTKQIKKIFHAHRRFASGFYLSELRRALQNNDKPRAKNAIRRLLWWGGQKRRIEALYGMIALIRGKNMEAPFTIYEKLMTFVKLHNEKRNA